MNSFITLDSIIKNKFEEKKLQPSSQIKTESKIEDKRFVDLKSRFSKITLSDVVTHFKSALDRGVVRKIKTRSGELGYSFTLYFNHAEKQEVTANIIDGELGIEAVVLLFDNNKKIFDFIKV